MTSSGRRQSRWPRASRPAGIARIILTTFGSLGDIHPRAALARELQRRGHTPVIVPSESYREKIADTGLTFHAIRPKYTPDDKDLLRAAMDEHGGPGYVIRRLMAPAVREMYLDLIEAAQGADLLLSAELVFTRPALKAASSGLRRPDRVPGQSGSLDAAAQRQYNETMPIFEYRCNDCEHDFETFVTADRRAACPSCQGADLVKRLSSPGMVGAVNGSPKPALPLGGGCGAGGAGCACRNGH